jgi:hypothetical protein
MINHLSAEARLFLESSARQKDEWVGEGYSLASHVTSRAEIASSHVKFSLSESGNQLAESHKFLFPICKFFVLEEEEISSLK